jgi:hypothetical protein
MHCRLSQTAAVLRSCTATRTISLFIRRRCGRYVAGLHDSRSAMCMGLPGLGTSWAAVARQSIALSSDICAPWGLSATPPQLPTCRRSRAAGGPERRYRFPPLQAAADFDLPAGLPEFGGARQALVFAAEGTLVTGVPLAPGSSACA